jgi:hypothetical protein
MHIWMEQPEISPRSDANARDPEELEGRVLDSIFSHPTFRDVVYRVAAGLSLSESQMNGSDAADNLKSTKNHPTDYGSPADPRTE